MSTKEILWNGTAGVGADKQTVVRDMEKKPINHQSKRTIFRAHRTRRTTLRSRDGMSSRGRREEMQEASTEMYDRPQT